MFYNSVIPCCWHTVAFESQIQPSFDMCNPANIDGHFCIQRLWDQTFRDILTRVSQLSVHQQIPKASLMSFSPLMFIQFHLQMKQVAFDHKLFAKL